ncbi:RHS repeat domain-containing protein [Rheinheimera sp.]|uniref:RHS repeat domain-containing protein n=1 Tax=Rheinheimera sp. TaxID=1869214 RepID=UPI0027B87CDA|nr:RHS repeat-associated core domain-containing protein [Rheinheimera sp.]
MNTQLHLLPFDFADVPATRVLFVAVVTAISLFSACAAHAENDDWAASIADPYRIEFHNANSPDTEEDPPEDQPIHRAVLNELNVKFELTPETTDLVGESVDLSSGALSFQMTDMQIPGNFPAEVAIRRRHHDKNFTHRNTAEFGDWGLSVPAIHNTLFYVGGVLQGFWGRGKECSASSQQMPPAYMYQGSLIEAFQYWNGVTLNVGSSAEKLIAATSADAVYTTKSNWRISCYPRTSGIGEGFKATSPDGTIYYFEVPHMVRAAMWSYPQAHLYQVFMRVSKVSDRFGNEVFYNYEKRQMPSGLQSNNLVSISSSDGRLITLKYEHETEPYLVTSITSNGKTWHYHYVGEHIFTLDKVVLPDQSYWDYNLSQLSEVEPYNGDLPNSERGECNLLGYREAEGFIKHPLGMKAVFKTRSILHGRTGTPTRSRDNYETYEVARCYLTMSVISKSLTGAGINFNWSYDYSQNKGAYIGQEKQSAGVTINGYDSGDLKTTKVTAPDGSITEHVFYRKWDYLDGTEVATIYRDTDGTSQLRQITKSFLPSALIGSSEQNWSNRESITKRAHQTVNETQEYVAGLATDYFRTEFSGHNQFGAHEREVTSNNLGTPSRTTDISYQHDLTNWLLNLETNRQISQGGQSLSLKSASYYGPAEQGKSKVKTISQFGQLLHTSSYNNDGTLAKITYAMNNRWVQYGAYKRGKAQSFTLPGRISGEMTAQLAVNDSGTISWVRDLNGYETSYKYDLLDRLELIDHKDTKWTDTEIRYDVDLSGNGSLLQSISKGNYRKTILLDALLQPVLSKEWDAENEQATVRYQRQQFNAYGKASFQSVVSDTLNQTYGTTTSYDGLQRVIGKTNTAEGDLTYRYLGQNQISVKNGRGHTTTTQYLAFGSPAQELATQIQQPEGVLTNISYNLADLPLQISQGGVTEQRLYNTKMQLCLQKRPETGIKVMQYNLLGQIEKYAEGFTGTASHCTDYNNVAASWVTIAFDNLGEELSRTYADGSTPQQKFERDNQGNLKAVTVNNIRWSYDYNSLHLLEKETLTLDGRSYVIDQDYNTLANLQSLTLAGTAISYAPDALGNPTRVADASTSFASAVRFYADGQLKDYVLGNGMLFSQQLDHKFRPYERLVKQGSSQKVAQRYNYDSNNNIDVIYDLVNTGKTVRMSYDELDRLETANGYWGNGLFVYDALGNIKNKNLGTQQLTLSYDVTKNRLQSVTGGYSFGYDDRGNVNNNGKRTFTFNRANQMQTSGAVNYQYDGHGRRVKKTSTTTSYSVYNNAGQLLLTDGPQGLTRYIYLGKELIAKTGPATAAEDKPGYTGHVEDRDIGLTYMQQRYYDPVIGRFYSNDPVGFSADNPMMFNRYAYGNNNPYKYTDPDGTTVIIHSRSLDMSGGSMGAHTFTTVTKSNGESTTISSHNVDGKNVVSINHSSDTGEDVSITDSVTISPPEGVSQEDFDNSVISQGEYMTTLEPLDYSAIPSLPNQGNCHTTTTQVIGGSGGSIPKSFDPKGANPDLGRSRTTHERPKDN